MFVRQALLAGVAVLVSGSAHAEEQAAGLRAEIESWAQPRAFNGVILFEGDQDVRYLHGTADAETDRPLTMDTRFQTGSVEKYFAAITVFALVEQGVLDLDAPISDYLPDYRADTGSAVTLRDLLTNRSGLPNDMSIAFRRIASGEAEQVDAMTTTQAVTAFASGDLNQVPGEVFDYVLVNWLLVQHIVEQASGMSYADARQENVFTRAGMSQSGGYIHDLGTTEPHVLDAAIGFDPADANGQGDYWTPQWFKGSYTTARDLQRLERALDDGDVLNPDSLAEFRSVQVPDSRYAYGGRFSTWNLCGEQFAVSTQAGSNGASNMISAYLPARRIGAAMTTNVDTSQGQMFELAHRLFEIELGCG